MSSGAAQSQRDCLHPVISTEEGTAGVPYRYCTSCGHIFAKPTGEDYHDAMKALEKVYRTP